MIVKVMIWLLIIAQVLLTGLIGLLNKEIKELRRYIDVAYALSIRDRQKLYRDMQEIRKGVSNVRDDQH